MKDLTKKIIGQRINQALIEKGVKQKDLAKAIGVTDNTISYFINWKRTPNTEQIIEISKFLDVSTDYLLGKTNVMSSNTDLQAICNYIGIGKGGEELITFLKETAKHITLCYDTYDTLPNRKQESFYDAYPLLEDLIVDIIKHIAVYKNLIINLKSEADIFDIYLKYCSNIISWQGERHKAGIKNNIFGLYKKIKKSRISVSGE